MKSKIRLEEINAGNWYDCCKLELDISQQEFIEPNAISIAQSKFEETLKAYAIYLDEQIVGFLMYNSVVEELDGYWIYRIMVDKNHQKKGIGKKAAEMMIHEMQTSLKAKKIIAGYHPSNISSHCLWASLGFVDKGDRFGREMAVVLEL